MRTALKLVVGLVVALVLVVAGVYGWASMKNRAILARTIDTHTVDFPIPFPLTEAEVARLDQEAAATGSGGADGGGAAEMDLDVLALEGAVERGEHLTRARYACRECHGSDFGGGVMVEDPMIGRLLGPNLTAGQGGRTADYTAMDWDRIVRHGVRPDGTPAIMPSEEFGRMSDEELSDIVASIRSEPAVDAETAPRKFGLLGTMLVAFNQIHLAADIVPDHNASHTVRPPMAEATAAFGGHLSGTCAGCHGATFVGGPIPGAPPGWAAASNLTPAGNLSTWSVADFATVLRTGQRPDGTTVAPPMDLILPFGQNMTDVEVEALCLYLKSLPKAETAQ